MKIVSQNKIIKKNYWKLINKLEKKKGKKY